MRGSPLSALRRPTAAGRVHLKARLLKPSATALAVVLTLGPLSAALVQSAQTDPLLQGFQDPPSSARPRVWWHWMNGNVTKEGIRLDLEWMQRVGIGGFQNFDAALATPQVACVYVAGPGNRGNFAEGQKCISR